MYDLYYMVRVATKPVFRVSVKASFKPVSSATETSSKNEILLVASLDMVLTKTGITKVLCACVVRKLPKDRFSLLVWRPI